MTVEDLAAGPFDPDHHPAVQLSAVCTVTGCGVRHPSGGVCGYCRQKVRDLRAAKRSFGANRGVRTVGPLPKD